MKEHTLHMPDWWSHLTEELLEIVSKNVEDCFDAIHAALFAARGAPHFPILLAS